MEMEEIKPQKTILLVDDDEIHLLFTELLLNDEYKIFTVKSGKKVLEFLDKNHLIPDLIMLDVLMPDMDGWTVFNKIKEIAALKSTPIMFFSSMEDESIRKKAHEIGAYDYVVKPCEQTDLLNRIKDTLQKAEHNHKKKDG